MQLKHEMFVGLVAGLVGGMAGAGVVLLGVNCAASRDNAVGTPKIVTAHEFRLADKQGKPRAWLDFDDQGQPELQLQPTVEAGHVSLGFDHDKQSAWYPSLSLSGADGMNNVNLHALPTGPEVNLISRAGGLLTLSCDKDETTVSACGAKAYFKVAEAMQDGAHVRAVVGATETENTETGATTSSPLSSITLFNKGGHVLWTARY